MLNDRTITKPLCEAPTHKARMPNVCNGEEIDSQSYVYKGMRQVLCHNLCAAFGDKFVRKNEGPLNS